MNREIEERLKELSIEDFIWVIYIGIIILSWYSNSLERKYFTQNDEKVKKQYREVMIGIFVVLVIVYFYFLYSSYQGIKDLKETDSKKKKELVILSFFGSLFIVMSGLIYLYIAIQDEDLSVELAFN